MFTRISGTPNVQPFVKTASTALSANGFVTLTSGQLVAGAADVMAVLGLCLETIASTDADYATARPVLVDMVDDRSLLLGDITGGSITAANVGYYFDLADATHADGTEAGALASAGADGGASGGGPLILVGFISATQGYFMVNSSYLNQSVLPTS